MMFPITNRKTGISSVWLIAALIFCTHRSLHVQAWGKQGHEIIGNLAWFLLSRDVQHKVEVLLNVSSSNPQQQQNYCDEYCSPLARVADWADRARYSQAYHWSAPLHYIDVRDDLAGPAGCQTPSDDQCQLDYDRDCPNDICAAGAIVNYTQQLDRLPETAAATDLDDNHPHQRREALMFLTHFIGDIHQPLHCSRTTDRGGNSIHVHFLNKTILSSSMVNSRDYHESSQAMTTRHRATSMRNGQTYRRHHDLNLHAVWDDSIIETALARDYQTSRNTMELYLLNFIWHTQGTSRYNDTWLACGGDGRRRDCTTLWGTESWEMALEYAYQDEDGVPIVNGTHLSEGYYASRVDVVQERLAVAAVRLAHTLERAF